MLAIIILLKSDHQSGREASEQRASKESAKEKGGSMLYFSKCHFRKYFDGLCVSVDQID